MNRREQISTVADFSFPEIETCVIVITCLTSAIFLLYIAVTKIVFYEKIITIWGITHTSKREPELYVKLRNLVRMVCMVNVSIGFGVHIDRKHAYTLY
jgi:hypothetical protein